MVHEQIDDNAGDPGLWRSASTKVTLSGIVQCLADELVKFKVKTCLYRRHANPTRGSFIQIRGSCRLRTATEVTLARPVEYKTQCTTTMSGDYTIRLQSNIPEAVGSQSGPALIRRKGRVDLNVHCRDAVESDALLWRRLAVTMPGAGLIATGQAPYNILKLQMGPAPTEPFNAWSPHHLIPVGAKGTALPAHEAQALAYRCHMHPNDRRNGLYLRNRQGALANGTGGYSDLVQSDATNGTSWSSRPEHWNYPRTYAAKVSQAMRHMPAPTSCRADDSRAGWAILHDRITEKFLSNHIPGVHWPR
jgi:hypothetical protein